MGWRFWPAALAACLIAWPAAAQSSDAPVATAPAAAPCELHVWPGSDLIHLYYGWTHGGTINGSLKGREGYPVAPENPLTAEVQGQLLAGMDLPTLLALPGYAVIVHPQPLSSREIRASTTRLAASDSPCCSSATTALTRPSDSPAVRPPWRVDSRRS